MLQLVEYKSLDELRRIHQEIRSFKMIYQIPRGQTAEGIRMALSKRNIDEHVYQVGNFVWKPAETSPKVNRDAARVDVA